jgi:TrkA domain protein
MSRSRDNAAMREIQETRLPGVGVRHDFITVSGVRIGVISHRSGRKELLIYDKGDPDRCSSVVRLDEDDQRALDELLGASRVTEQLTALQQSVEGLTIDWLPIARGSEYDGRTIGDSAMRKRTGVSIVAVVRDTETVAAPPPEFELRAGDTVVAIGTAEGIGAAFRLLSGA